MRRCAAGSALCLCSQAHWSTPLYISTASCGLIFSECFLVFHCCGSLSRGWLFLSVSVRLYPRALAVALLLGLFGACSAQFGRNPRGGAGGGGGGGGGYGGGGGGYGAAGQAAAAAAASNAVARPGGDASLDDSVRLFLNLDQDGDGHLDVHELPPALYGLLNYDQDGDGRISAAEYLGALRNVQLEMSLDQQCRHQYGPNAEFDGVDACR